MNILLVVPCFNEANRLPSDEFLRFSAEHPEVSYLFVNDGSSDGTAAYLESLVREISLVHPGGADVLTLNINSGKAEAVRQGFLWAMKKSKAELVGFWDADLATPLSEAVEMSGYMTVHPTKIAVFGSRILKLGNIIKRNPFRHYFGRLFATAVSIMTGLPVYDSQCGAKIFRASSIRDIFGESFESRWFFDVEILFRIKAISDATQTVFEWPLKEWRDVHGSKLKARDFLKVPLGLYQIWKRYK